MAGPESIDGGKKWLSVKEPMIIGEAPIYRSSDSTLHWVDALSNPARLFIVKLDDAGDAVGDTRVFELEDSVSVVFFRKDKPGSYLGAYSRGVCFIDEATGKLEVVKEIIPAEQREELRMNDCGIDAKGRFWLSEIDLKTMGVQSPDESTSRGRLWRYDPDGSLHLMVDHGIAGGNGVEWSPDNKTCEFWTLWLALLHLLNALFLFFLSASIPPRLLPACRLDIRL